MNHSSENANQERISPKKSYLAVIALIFALLGIISVASFYGLIAIDCYTDLEIAKWGFWILGPLALLSFVIAFLLGIVALLFIKRSPVKQSGSGYATAALILSIVFYSVLFTAFFIVSTVNQMRDKAERARSGKAQIQQIGRVIIEYARDNDGYLPVAANWCNLLLAYNKNLSEDIFKLPERTNGICNFAFNRNLDGLRLSDIPGNVVLLYVADGDLNLTGGAEDLETMDRKDEVLALVLFADQVVGEYWFRNKRVRGCYTDKYSYNPLRWEP